MKKFEYVSYIDVNLSTGKGQSTVYANSWQDLRLGDAVKVTITFVVTNKNYEQVILTQQEIEQCVLLGDYHTGEIFTSAINPSPGQWGVSVYSVSVKNQLAENAGVVYQSITYSIRRNGYGATSRTCCAVLTPDDGDSIVTSCKGTEFDSGVTVTPLPGIWYDYSNLGYTRVDTKNETVGKYVVDQDNYYVSIPDGAIVSSSSLNLRNDIFVKALTNDNPPTYQILYQVGEEGIYNLYLDNGDIIYLPYNQRPGQLCLTRVWVENCTMDSTFSKIYNVAVYDAYKNEARLAFSPKDDCSAISMANA
ncbi:hypothetical protein ACEZEZ_00275 [Kluyvera ascorbata]|uniref:hypothetical protein n=1 Tax=Kluyvera ascorbata TaxID=51288 RepID=UPI0035CCF65C